MTIVQLAKIFKALSHPNRLELFLEIMKSQESSYENSECMIADMIQRLKIGAPTVSHHLKELANADLIITERRGKFLVARVNESTLRKVAELLSCNCQKS